MRERLVREAVPRRASLLRVVALSLATLLVGCAGGETRPSPVVGTFRLTNALEGEGVVLAPVALDGAVPRLRLIASDDAANAASHWRLTAFGQGLHRVSSVEAEGGLSLAAGYGSGIGTADSGRVSVDGVELARSRRTASQLWRIVPLEDGHCRLVSALFPDRALGLAEAAGEPRLVPSADTPEQRWRLAPVEGTEADGLPALCGGRPRAD